MVPIEEQKRENCIRWFGHVQRRPMRAPVQKGDFTQIEGLKKTRKAQNNVVRKDMCAKERIRPL